MMSVFRTIRRLKIVLVLVRQEKENYMKLFMIK